MSMDYDFWKYKDGVYLNNQKVYETLSNGDYVEGLEELPVDDIVKKIKYTFTEYSQDGLDENSWESETKGSFRIYTTSQFVRVDVYRQMPYESINKFIDIMLEFNCPLYDPQINIRFDDME